jgi:hypothetical protein
MTPTFDVEQEQPQNSKVNIECYYTIYRYVLDALKVEIIFLLIIFVIILSAAIIISLNTGKFALVLALTCVFLLLATLMNRIVDSYGD